MFELTAPATKAAAIITGTGTPMAMTRRQPPKTAAPASITSPVARNASRAAATDPSRAPNAKPDSTAPTTAELSPRSIVM